VQKKALEKILGTKKRAFLPVFPKLPDKQKSLTVQVDFDSIIGTGQTEVCFFDVEMGNVG